MTGIKLCGLSREEDILAANELLPEYIGFVFAPKSKRYVSKERAKELKAKLDCRILSVGVFVDSPLEEVKALLDEGIIEIAQLHGGESEAYILRLKELTKKPVIKAFSINSQKDILAAKDCAADYVLLDGRVAGSGNPFDRSLIQGINRQYFLAGGLDPENVQEAVNSLSPYAVDVSSGIEREGKKDKIKMTEFVCAVRRAGGEDRV